MADDDVLPLNPLAQRYLEQCFLGSTKDAPRVSRLVSLLQDALLLPAAPVSHRRRSLRHRNRHNIRLRSTVLTMYHYCSLLCHRLLCFACILKAPG